MLLDELDIEAFKSWRKEFASAEFKCSDDGSFKVNVRSKKCQNQNTMSSIPMPFAKHMVPMHCVLYEMFLGPLEQYKPWNTAGITGVSTFLKKLWKLYINETGIKATDEEPLQKKR